MPRNKTAKTSKLSPAERKHRAAVAAAARWGNPPPPPETADAGAIEPRNAILNAAVELFARDGFDSPTLQTIAQRADVGLQTVYRYFASKDSLATECRKILIEWGSKILEAAIADHSKPETKLCVLCLTLAYGRFDHSQERRAYVSLLDPKTEKIRSEYIPVLKPYWERYISLVQEAGLEEPERRVITIFALTIGLSRFSPMEEVIPEFGKSTGDFEKLAQTIFETALPELNWKTIRDGIEFTSPQNYFGRITNNFNSKKKSRSREEK